MNKEHNRIFTMANVAFCIAEKVSRFFFSLLFLLACCSFQRLDSVSHSFIKPVFSLKANVSFCIYVNHPAFG